MRDFFRRILKIILRRKNGKARYSKNKNSSKKSVIDFWLKSINIII